jgi:hypothetical protein
MTTAYIEGLSAKTPPPLQRFARCASCAATIPHTQRRPVWRSLSAKGARPGSRPTGSIHGCSPAETLSPIGSCPARSDHRYLSGRGIGPPGPRPCRQESSQSFLATFRRRECLSRRIWAMRAAPGPSNAHSCRPRYCKCAWIVRRLYAHASSGAWSWPPSPSNRSSEFAQIAPIRWGGQPRSRSRTETAK